MAQLSSMLWRRRMHLSRSASTLEPMQKPPFNNLPKTDGIYVINPPQRGKDIKVQVLSIEDEDMSEEHTLINPEILEYVGEKQYFNEGCLSIPDIHEDVLRTEGVKVRWYDEQWQLHEEVLHGMFARVAQHEIDHLEGKVFTDRLSPLRKTMIKRRLNEVIAGRVRVSYRMKRNK